MATRNIPKPPERVLEGLLRRANEDEDRMRGLATRAAEVQMACATVLKRAGVERF